MTAILPPTWRYLSPEEEREIVARPVADPATCRHVPYRRAKRLSAKEPKCRCLMCGKLLKCRGR